MECARKIAGVSPRYPRAVVTAIRFLIAPGLRSARVVRAARALRWTPAANTMPHDPGCRGSRTAAVRVWVGLLHGPILVVRSPFVAHLQNSFHEERVGTFVIGLSSEPIDRNWAEPNIELGLAAWTVATRAGGYGRADRRPPIHSLVESLICLVEELRPRKQLSVDDATWSVPE